MADKKTAMADRKTRDPDEKEALRLAETTDVSPKQAKDLMRKHGKDSRRSRRKPRTSRPRAEPPSRLDARHRVVAAILQLIGFLTNSAYPFRYRGSGMPYARDIW
ncbi:hypothetical protein NKL07_05465 [Mesorhizobium sp. C280B]|uniref:hypothetical protein n=1 Tax=unclassified Mesorhizobium TaxID=325217 RepID=UPI0004CF9532|nr:hypothetical protein [Mesorhizobium sp. LSJC280B00]